MKLRLEKSALAEAVAYVARMIPAKAAMPVLSGIVLSAEADGVMAGGALNLSVFDYETSGRTSCPAEVLEPGTVLVSGRMLAGIVKSLPARPVEVSTDGSKVRITCGSAKFTVLTMPMDDYPTIPDMPATAGVISGDVLAGAVAQVAFAASKDPTPPMLTGVRVEAAGDRMTLMATDRYRLAVKEVQWRPGAPDVEFAALVRGSTLSEVAKTVGSGVDVTVGVDGLIGFESAGRRSTALLMDGQYPPVLGLFPKESAGCAVVNTAELMDAVKRVGVVAERNTPIGLDFADGQVELDGGRGEDAQASETVDATLDGDPIAIRFNPAYLLDGLQAIPHQYVRVTYLDPGKPAVLTGQADVDGMDDTSYRYLLMPMWA